MIRQHTTLEHVARRLTEQLAGAVLVESFTQERNVCILQFLIRHEVVSVQLDVSDAYGTIFIRPDTNRARKNSIDFAPVLLKQPCVLITKHPHDRIISFWFRTHQLHVLLYSGGMGNIVVTDNSTGLIVDALQNKSSLVGTRVQESTYIPTLPRIYENERQFRDDIDSDVATTNTYYVLRNASGEILFSLIPLHDTTIIESTPDIFSALRRTLAMRRSELRTNSMIKEIVKELTKRQGRLRKGIAGMESDAAMADKASMNRLQADLLMTVPDKHRAGRSSIDVTDWEDNAVVIQLDPAKTVHQLIEHLYTKARKAEQGKAEREQRLPMWRRQLAEVDQLLDSLASIHGQDELDTLYQTIFKRKYMQEKKNAAPEPTGVYRVFDLGDGYTLYVGKSAANNDQLTMKFAKQNDWWFHARGVSGSHAVLRVPPGVTKVPKEFIERSASIAAYYSNSRNAGFTPVVYTQRKYVRKPKGAAVGAVTLEREDVIMVKPQIPE